LRRNSCNGLPSFSAAAALLAAGLGHISTWSPGRTSRQPCGLASSSFSSLLSLLLENIPLPSGKYYVLKGSGVRFMSLPIDIFDYKPTLANYRIGQMKFVKQSIFLMQSDIWQLYYKETVAETVPHSKVFFGAKVSLA
jgi:hypothetical protein